VSAVELSARNTSVAIEMIPVDQLTVGPNIRTQPGELDDLVASIREIGILQPIKVRPSDSGYVVIWGQRRLLAARLAGLEAVPAMVVDEAKAVAALSIEQLSENLIRQDLNPIDEAKAIRAVLDADKALTQRALAEKLGRSEAWIANTLALLKVDETVQAHLQSGELTAAHAKALIGLPPKVQRSMAKGAVTYGTSAHDLERNAKGERERQADLDKRSKQSVTAGERAVAALREANTSEDAAIYVAGQWNLDSEVIAKAVANAGWKLTEAYSRAATATCDCAVFMVRATDDGAAVTRVCVNEEHWNAGQRQRDQERAAAQAKKDAEEKELHDAIVEALAAQPLHPVVGRLLVRNFAGYGGSTWADYAALSDAKVNEAIAHRLATQHNGYGAKPLTNAAALAMLRGGLLAGEPAPAKARKAARS
jgi:ParB/RepB/Spo0J family partition protein